MPNIVYLTSRMYVSPDRLVKHIEDYIGITVEIIEYNSQSNVRNDYIIQFKETIPEDKYEKIKQGNAYIIIDYYANRIYTDNTMFGSPTMTIAQHHYNVTTKTEYLKYPNTSSPSVYKYEICRWVETLDTPFLYL